MAIFSTRFNHIVQEQIKSIENSIDVGNCKIEQQVIIIAKDNDIINAHNLSFAGLGDHGIRMQLQFILNAASLLVLHFNQVSLVRFDSVKNVSCDKLVLHVEEKDNPVRRFDANIIKDGNAILSEWSEVELELPRKGFKRYFPEYNNGKRLVKFIRDEREKH